MTVPITADINQQTDFAKVYNVNLAFFDPKGEQFGHLITLRVKCVRP